MQINMSKKPTVSEQMPSNVFGQLVAYLASRGYNPSKIIGNSAAGRSRQEIFDLLKEALSEV